MKIGCFVMTYNEERMLPLFIKHYSKFCDHIYVMDNESTDSTKDIAMSFGCSVVSWSNPKIEELKYIEIKNNIYKSYRHLYDYIIVCDCDEFLYHKNIIEYITNHKEIDIFRPIGYQMVSNAFLFDDIEKIKYGVVEDLYSKCVLFKSTIDISFEVGCHSIRNQNYTQTDIQLRHFKYINEEFVIERYKQYYERMSDTNKMNSWGVQYTWGVEQIKNHFRNLESRMKEIEL